ncbi:MAG: hypothetical protein HPY55_00055 [Firmicutes bacterium]|nr:hypothetical protein [Bacillota bacterium]
MAKAQIEDDEILQTSALWKSGTVASRFGQPLVSDPTCLAAVHVVGAYSEERVLIRDICTKGVAGGKIAAPLVEAIDFGYPYHVKPRENNYITGRFMSLDGYPIPVYESTHVAEGDNQAAKSRIFGWDGVIYLVTETQNVGSQRMNGWLHGTGGQANNDVTMETVGGHRLITAQEKTSDLWFVIGCTPEDQMAIQSSGIVLNEGPIADKVDPIVGGACYYGFGRENMGLNGEMLICFAMGTDKASTQAKVAGALSSGWRIPLESCMGYWRSFFAGLRERWLYVPAELRFKGYMALQQSMMAAYRPNSQGTFLGAGPGAWYGNFIRDTAWVIKALAPIKPDVAGEMLDWFANVAEPIYGSNSYGIDGAEPGNYHNTDNAATWLLAVGEYWKQTRDLPRMTALKAQIDSALQYAQVNYVPADGHIVALHPHDFADDGYFPLPTGDIKYESMVDILWIAGLEAISPVYTALGDSVRASFCTQTATEMRAHIDDYRVPGTNGRLCHSLKPDGTQQDAAWWFASMLYDAWLLGNEDSWKWCSWSKQVLGVKNVSLNYGLVISRQPTEQNRDESWGPFLGIVAKLAAEHGDLEPASFLATAFPSGTFPEFWHLSMATGSVPAHYSHAMSFPWTHASVLELVETLAALR